MAGRDDPWQRAGSLLVAALTVALPLAALVWSFAQLSSGALFQPSPRVASAVLPIATAYEAPRPPTTSAGTETLPSGGASAINTVIETAPDATTALAPDTVAVVGPTAAPLPMQPEPPIAIPAATIVAAAPVILPTASPTPRAEAWGRESSFNFIALGVDQRQEGELTRTDTLMVGSVDLVRNRLTIVSIPRDLLVEIPGYGQDRINAAYVYGEQFKEPDGGIGLLKRTIERNFGIPIQHFGLVDFKCFRTAVDSLGGVTVDVPSRIVDTHYPTDDYGYKTVRFDIGPQRLDGERALEYARTRYADNDFHRIRRQQLIVSALRTQLLQLRSLPAVPSILGGCRGMRSDLGWRDYLALAGVVRGLGDKDVTFRTIDEGMAVETTLASGAAVLLPRWEPIRTLVRESFPVAPRPPTTADLPDAPVSETIVGESSRSVVTDAPGFR